MSANEITLEKLLRVAKNIQEQMYMLHITVNINYIGATLYSIWQRFLLLTY